MNPTFPMSVAPKDHVITGIDAVGNERPIVWYQQSPNTPGGWLPQDGIWPPEPFTPVQWREVEGG